MALLNCLMQGMSSGGGSWEIPAAIVAYINIGSARRIAIIDFKNGKTIVPPNPPNGAFTTEHFSGNTNSTTLTYAKAGQIIFVDKWAQNGTVGTDNAFPAKQAVAAGGTQTMAYGNLVMFYEN